VHVDRRPEVIRESASRYRICAPVTMSAKKLTALIQCQILTGMAWR